MNKTETHDLTFLNTNSYWGRGILIGTTPAGRIAAAYFIMGRSENSRNRYFYKDGDNLAIAPYDADKLEDPTLIIYYPIKRCGDRLIVTNGDQTDTVEAFLQEDKTFEDALRTRTFEPDDPHFTPRISGLIDRKDGSYRLSILKDGDGKGGVCSRQFFDYEPQPGTGYLIHTYEGNETPLPTFAGEPKRCALTDDLELFTETIWNNLDEDNKISLCTMMIDPQSGTSEERLRNKRMGD